MSIQFVGLKGGTQAGATSGTVPFGLSSGLTGGSRSGVQAGDFVLAIFGTGSTTDRTLSITDGTNPYTLIDSELYSADTEATNLRIAYKFMGSTPDASVVFGNTGNTADGGAMGVYVYSGVDPNNPLDVAAAIATGINSNIANPPSITPVTQGAYVVAVGAAAASATKTFTSSDLSNFGTVGGSDTHSGTIGIGHIAWGGSGAVDPAAFGGTSAVSTDSWAAITIALRPARAVPDSSTHAHPQTSPAVAPKWAIAPASAAHAHSETSPTVTLRWLVAPGDALHGHSVSSPDVTSDIITPSPTFHAHPVSAPVVTPRWAVAPAAAVHAHQATPSSVTLRWSVTPAAVLHAHLATSPLVGPPIVTPPERIISFDPNRTVTRTITFGGNRVVDRTITLG